MSQEAHDTIEQFLLFILEKVLEAKDLLTKLYSISNENLSIAGIEDHDATAQAENRFIHCYSAFQCTKAATTILSRTLDDIQGSFSELSRMGLLSPFLEDDSIATAEQIVERIKEKENNPEAFKDSSDPSTETDIEGVIHPLAQLLFHCEVGVGLPNALPHKETIHLSGAQENFCNMVKPSEDEWSPL